MISMYFLRFVLDRVFGLVRLCFMMLCSAVLTVLLLLAPLTPSHSRSLHSPERAMQVGRLNPLAMR